jgi:hypothetical protein
MTFYVTDVRRHAIQKLADIERCNMRRFAMHKRPTLFFFLFSQCLDEFISMLYYWDLECNILWRTSRIYPHRCCLARNPLSPCQALTTCQANASPPSYALSQATPYPTVTP